MAPIVSAGNPRIVRIRRPAMRKDRRRTGLAFAEGVRPVAEALAHGSVEALVLAPDLVSSAFAKGLVGQALGAGVEVTEVSERVFRSLSAREQPQGIAAVVRQRWQRLADLQLPERACWLGLEAVSDPGNLGTLLRTCDGAGVDGVILLDHTADPYDPTAIRASLGAVFSGLLVRSSWPEVQRWARHHSTRIVGTSPSAMLSYREAAYGERTVVVLGSEQRGLSEAGAAACDMMVGIPMLGRCDSLNVAVAGALVLYEVTMRAG